MKKIKIKNKLLFLLLLITIITFFVGLLLPSILDNHIKEDISNKIITLVTQIRQKQIIKISSFWKTMWNHSLNLCLIWILGMSIIGIPIMIFIYLTKVLILSLELTFLILNYKNVSLFFIPFYLLPNIISVFLEFILLFYAIKYSYTLIQIIFFRKKYTLTFITKQYHKIFVITLLGTIITTILEIFLLPKIYIYVL